MSISSDDIKVKRNYPGEPCLIEEIESLKAKWILDQQVEKYGEKIIDEVYQIWIRIKNIETKGVPYEKAKLIVMDKLKEM